MASDGTGTNWNIAVPANTDNERDGATEIREVKAAVAIRIDYEHSAFNTNSLGGVHVAGSAQGFYQTNTPSTTPGGDALTGIHAGRLWLNNTVTSGVGTAVLYHFDGTNWVTPSLIPGSVPGTVIAAGSITSGQIGAGEIHQSNISNASVGTLQLIDSNVSSGKIAAGAILNSHMSANNVLTVNIADTNVTTGKIALGAITGALLAAAAVGSTNIGTGQVTTTNIADASLTVAKVVAQAKNWQGSYTGNGSSSGPFFTAGFQPALVFIFDLAGNQKLYAGVNGSTSLNTVDGATTVTSAIGYSSTGFGITTSSSTVNTNGRSYVVVAFG